MVTLFSMGCSNGYMAPVLRDASQWPILDSAVNFRRLANDWKELDFVYSSSDEKIHAVPDIFTAYVSGMIIFRAELWELIFPAPCPELEFLPIRVAGKDWRLLNCLKTTKKYDPERSKLFRAEAEQIFAVHRLVVVDSTLEVCELFTLEDSNRAQLFCLQSFKERIEWLGLKGLSFREIGHCEI